MRPSEEQAGQGAHERFPFLLGRAFIEAGGLLDQERAALDFPSFWEGLSLRLGTGGDVVETVLNFPFFWEGLSLRRGGKAPAQEG